MKLLPEPESSKLPDQGMVRIVEKWWPDCGLKYILHDNGEKSLLEIDFNPPPFVILNPDVHTGWSAETTVGGAEDSR